MANEIISRIRAAQAPLQRRITKQQIKPLSWTGILTVQDANQSIALRKAKDTTAEEKHLNKL
jgi:hypothetical protein